MKSLGIFWGSWSLNLFWNAKVYNCFLRLFFVKIVRVLRLRSWGFAPESFLGIILQWKSSEQLLAKFHSKFCL